MSLGGGVRAVLLDAMGTLVGLEPPAPRLRAALSARLGVEVSEEAAARAMRAEIGYYRAHLHLGRDRAGLEGLRRTCAEIVGAELGPAVTGADPREVLAALLDALEFTAFPDVAPALEAWRAEGRRLVVVSNWDVSLHDALARAGLAGLVDGAVASAELGVAKPDPAIFRHALALAGAPASAAVHVGDSLAADVAGARAAGLREAILVRRGGAGAAVGDVRVIRSLAELVEPAP